MIIKARTHNTDNAEYVSFIARSEKVCKLNIGLMWLLKCLRPYHNTIANFRRDNPKAIKKVFRVTIQ